MEKRYSAAEVELHNKKEDLWIVIHGGVYDLTKFRQEHPGGEEVLLNLAGQDGSTCFDEIGHSEEAIQLRETFKIGRLASGNEKPDAPESESKGATTNAESRPRPHDSNEKDDWEYEEPKRESSPWLPLIIALGVAIYATLIYYLWF